MPPHKQLAALIRASERMFNLSPGDMYVTGGRYYPLLCYRQLAQLLAHERGLTAYQIAKAFGYTLTGHSGHCVSQNVSVVRTHISKGQDWWTRAKSELAAAWDEELARTA